MGKKMLIFTEMKNSTSNLYFKSKKTSLIILALVALFCSRMLFFFFDDPDGPNLLIVAVFALLICLFSFALYLFSPSRIGGIKRLLMAILSQILLVIILYFSMK
jgi:hypothetical protein